MHACWLVGGPKSSRRFVLLSFNWRGGRWAGKVFFVIGRVLDIREDCTVARKDMFVYPNVLLMFATFIR